MPFLNMTGLGKQVKEAYKAGRLQVGAFDTHSVIRTTYCGFAVLEDEEPNKMKAIITEYLGYVPTYDPTTAAAGFIEADNEQPQRDLVPEETTIIRNLIFNPHKTKAYVITPVIIRDRGQDIRIIQDLISNKCTGIRQEHLELISMKEIDYDIEGNPQGPEVVEETGVAYFHNQTTILAIQLYSHWTDKAADILDMLQLIEMRDEV